MAFRSSTNAWCIATCTKCLKSENAFNKPKFSTLAVIKKHSHMKGYLVFSLFDLAFVVEDSIVALLPELEASWDCSKRLSLSLNCPELSVFNWVPLLIHSVTSSDEACRAVNPLTVTQPHLRKIVLGQLSITRSARKQKPLTLAPSGYHNIHILDQFYPF